MAEKKNYDSEFCGNLPLNYTNSIQDYGCLLVLEKEQLAIVQVSENAAVFLGRSIPELLKLTLYELLGAEDIQRISLFRDKGLSEKIPFNLRFKQDDTAQEFHVLMHLKAGYLLLELEKVSELAGRDFTTVFQDVKQIMAAIDAAETIKSVCEVAVHELKRLSGFDGMLMYRFDGDWNGTVIAEEKDSRLDAYIGQTFPASDVPRQARELYLKNPYRLIPNRQYQPVKLYPVINPVTNSFTDLADCNLRSVAAVHLEYMKNMQVEASMSIRIIREEKLWGLISCHHLTAKYLDYEVCSVFEWLSSVISARISSMLNKEEYERAAELQKGRTVLTDSVYASESIGQGLLGDLELNVLDLFSATGAVVVVSGRTESKGKVPAQELLDDLLLWLEGKEGNAVFASNQLSAVYDDALEFAGIGSGLLVIPIDGSKGEYVICFRPEVLHTINWGGNPDQAINFEEGGKKYHPRTSFQLWQQRVEHQASPWSRQELEVAEMLRTFLFEYRTRQLYN